MHRISFTIIAVALFLGVRSNSASAQHVLDSTNFHVEWSDVNPNDPVRIDVLQWKGGPNLTLSFPGNRGCHYGDVEYFGNAWAPPDPEDGGVVLVGAGTKGSWTAGADGLSTVIKSISGGCKSSGRIHVTTKYKLHNAEGTGKPMQPDSFAQDHFLVERKFAFGSNSFANNFRPYVPRLYPDDQFAQVLHPDAIHKTLVSEDVYQCASGCQISDWDGTWFAIHDASDFRGVIIHRKASPFAVNLWVDFDGGSQTNASSVLDLQPEGGFTGTVTELEKLCFYDTSNWSQRKLEHLKLPRGCELPPK